MRCYYDNEMCDYSDGLWQCQTCHEWFCHAHWHSTDLGYNVECVACERERLANEQTEDQVAAA